MQTVMLVRLFPALLLVFLNSGCTTATLTSESPAEGCRYYHFSDGNKLHLRDKYVSEVNAVFSEQERLVDVSLMLTEGMPDLVSHVYIYPTSNIKAGSCRESSTGKGSVCRIPLTALAADARVKSSSSEVNATKLQEILENYAEEIDCH